MVDKQLQIAQAELSNHPMYGMLQSVEALRIFMQSHVYAVWDFMSLLKSLQRRLTCVTLPWRPAACPPSVSRFINEIVIGEECDLDADGHVASHFRMYLDAMREIGADTMAVEQFVESLDYSLLPPGVEPFVRFNLELAENGRDEEVAAAFLFGREKLIPAMFDAIVDVIKASATPCPMLIYYLDRHIELDGDEHGPLAESCLDALCGDDAGKRKRATDTGLYSLQLRWELWDAVAERIVPAKSQAQGLIKRIFSAPAAHQDGAHKAPY